MDREKLREQAIRLRNKKLANSAEHPSIIVDKGVVKYTTPVPYRSSVPAMQQPSQPQPQPQPPQQPTPQTQEVKKESTPTPQKVKRRGCGGCRRKRR